MALLLAVGTVTAGADPLTWASGASIVAPTNVNSSNPDIQINAVACPSAGDCTAVGSYDDQSGSSQGLLVTEAGGSWQPGIEAHLPNSPNVAPQVDLTSISCSSDGNCTAIGDYVDSHAWTEGVILTEAGGSWTKQSEVADPGGVPVAATPDVSLNSVSCPATGDCLVVGTYLNSQRHAEGLLETERNGKWAAASQAIDPDLPGNAAPEFPTGNGRPLVAGLNSVSCVSGGTCVAAGTYTDSNGGQQGLLLTGVQSSSWSFSGTEATLPAQAAADPDVSLSSISCPSSGQCAAVGGYHDSGGQQGLLLTETGGNWQAGIAAQLPADATADPGASLSAVSCTSAGECDAVGEYNDGPGDLQGLLLTETSGNWGQGVEPTLPADAGSTTFVRLSSVSCSAASSTCVAAGNYSDDSFGVRPVLLSQSADGSWSSPATEPALPGVGSEPAANTEAVSCAPAGSCAAVVDYTDAAGNVLAGAINGTASPPATPTLSLTAPPSTVTPGTPIALSALLSGGAGEVGTVTFGVFGPESSPPSSCAFGDAVVGSTPVVGDGTYAPVSDFTPTVAGDYWWYANYGGDLGDSPTASGCGPSMAETVVASPPVQTATEANTTTAPTPAPTPTPTPTPTAPKPTASLTAVKVSGAVLKMTVVCHATARQTCTGSLSLLVTESGAARASSAKRSVVIGNTRYKLKGGTRRRLSLVLNRTGKSLLRSRHTLTARLRLKIDKRTTLVRTVTFRRTKR